MKKNIIFFTFFLFTFDSFAGPKNRKIPQPVQKKSSFENLSVDESDPAVTFDIAAEKIETQILAPTVKELEQTRPLNSPRNNQTTDPDWVETHVPTEISESTPLSDFLQNWKMWLKSNIEDPKLSERFKRFFNLTKTYNIFLDELNNCADDAKQNAFDDLIKTFNTSENPRFGYELLSEAIVQAINDRQLSKVHLITNFAIKHRAHLPLAILKDAENYLTKENETDASAITAELAAILAGVHERARTIKAIRRPESPLADLSEENADDIARIAVDDAFNAATYNFVQPKQIKKS